MSSALVDTDIDRFIREQKSKLASEKNDLNEDDHYFKTSRRQWAEPDKENFIIAGSNEREERAETPAHQGYPVDNRQIIKQRKELSDQRKQEYNNYLKTRTDNRRKPKNLTPTQKSIQVGEYDNKIKERLHSQRKKEYNDYLNKAQKRGKTKRGRNLKYHNHNAVLTDRFDPHDYDAVARQHQDEKYHDYNLRLQLGSPLEYYETNDVYPDNDTSRIAGLPVGQYEENKKRNAEETKRKYRADLEKQLREKEKIIKRQYGVKSKKISRDEREKQLRIREEMLRKQLRVQGSPRRSIEKRDRKLYQPMQPQRCTCGYNFPRPDAEERAYLDFIRLRDKYDFRYQDEYDEWQRRQLAALSEIERRQLELRLKLERDLALHYLERDAMEQFSDEEKEAIRHCPVHIAKCSPCPSRSPSPHIDPPLYDPIEAEILLQSSETPERLLIGETSTEHREKLRQERQREYNDMMAQKRSRARRNILGDDEDNGWGIFGNRSEDDRKLANQRRDDLLINDKNQGAERRQWGEPSSKKPAEDKSKQNLGNSGGYFPADNSHIHRQKMAEERKREYQEMLQTSQKINRQPLHKRNQPEQKPNPQIQVQNPSAQTHGVQNQESKPADQSYTPSSPMKDSKPVQETNGYATPTKESQPALNSNGVSSQSKPANQNGNQKGQGRDPRRRVWKEDSQLDFFSSNRYEVRKQQPTDKFQTALKTDVGSHGQQPEKNGYVPSAAENARTQDYNERREEYNNMLKNQSRSNQRRYYEPENDEFMKRREERTPRQEPNQLESFIKTGPAPSGKENNQVENQQHANTNNSNISAAEEQKNDYNNMLKNNSKTPRRVYKEPSSDDFFDFGRIQKKNPEEKRPRERAPVDEERRQEYNNTIKSKPAPRTRPFRENSSDDFLKYGGHQRRVNHNGLRVSQSETFQNQEKNYQEKIKGGQTPRRRMWREPSKDDFFIGSTKYQKMGTPRTWREPSKEEILLDDKRENYRKKLEEERKNEYNEHLKKTMTDKKTWREPTKEDLFIKDSDDRKRKLQEERNKEYKELVQKKAEIGKRDWQEPSKEDLFIKDSNDRKKKLQEERNKEYQNLLQQKKAAEKSRDWREPQKEDLLIKDTTDRKKKLEEERKKEYQELLEKKNLRPREWREPSKEQLFISDTLDKKKKLQEQRKEEYNQLQKKQTQSRYHDLPPKPGTPGGFLNKLGSHEKQRQKLQEERQKEYNRMQAEKLGLHDFDDHRILKTKDEEIFATLPGLNYHGSATQRAKAKERNEEYNDFKQVFDTPRRGRGEEPPGAPRKGWGTPTYEEMLEKKRNEEQRYRRLNDPDYSRPGLKAYNSEGALHRLEDEKRLKDIEKDISTKKSVLQNGILDDPDWLRSSYEAEHDRTYSRLLERLKNWNDETQEDDIKKEEPTKETPVNKKASKQDNHLPPHGPAAHAPVYHDYPPRGIKDAPTYLPDANKHRFYASLPVGEQESQAELQRRKDAYKKELERQMQEAEAARRKNRVVEPPQAEVVKQQQPVQPRVVVIPNVQKQPEVIQAAAQQQYQLATGGDRLSPRAEMLLGRTRDLERLERRLKKIESQQHGISQLDLAELDFMSSRDPRRQMHQPSHETTGILEQGFDRLLDPPKPAVIKPPIGLAYQPSTYVTGGQNFDKFNSIDQVYHYYGAQNPLDIPVAAPAANYGVAPAVVPSGGVVVDNYRAMGGGGGGGGGGYVSPTMAYNDVRGVGEGDPNADTEAERKAKRAQAQIYQRELERQMEEKKYKKTLEKQEQERYERKLEEDIKNYNPYGRGGAGAPMKDAQGNTVADLRALQKGYSPRYDTGYVDPYISPRGVARAASPKDDLIKTPPAQTTALGEATHARGGHGIFGHPKTEAEKTQADRYKEELKRQIDRKKRDAEMERERERREEEKQSKIVEEQRKKMQEEYDEEKRRIMAKEEEARLRNAEIIKMQEDRKTDEERLKEELEKKKRDEARIDYERERLAREEKRGESPPVPAIKSNNPTDNSEKTDDNKNDKIQSKNDKNGKRYAARTDSPLIPTLRHRTNEVYFDTEPAPRNNSADVLNQLAHMRRQLQSERKRVENMLEETRNEPDVYDPRLVNRVAVPVQQTQQYQKADIFETALNRNAVQVRRAPTADHANPSVLQEFDHLKHKADTDSRKQFRRLYPVDPRTQEELESQQAALLRQQEHRLMGYGHSPSDTDTIGINSTSPQAMLHSNSAFIDVEGMDRNLFPDDFDDFPKRNDSARQRRRDRDQGRSDAEIPRNYNPMGSITSLDVDKISRKNEDRLQRLKELQDDVSLYDPDDVLNRFMEKQSHNSRYEADDISRILTPE